MSLAGVFEIIESVRVLEPIRAQTVTVGEMPDTIILITGGNTGLGLELIHALCRSSHSYTILMGSRSLENAKEAIKDVAVNCVDREASIEPVQMDVEDDHSIQAAFELIKQKHGRLDVLVNNAGTLKSHYGR